MCCDLRADSVLANLLNERALKVEMLCEPSISNPQIFVQVSDLGYDGIRNARALMGFPDSVTAFVNCHANERFALVLQKFACGF